MSIECVGALIEDQCVHSIYSFFLKKDLRLTMDT